jgi:HD-like signal output (HDOD) protein
MSDQRGAVHSQEELPVQAAAAANVLRLVEDPDVGVPDLAAAIGADPVLAARVIRVANSSYYGLSGRVATLPFAVSIVGFQSVRALAVAAAAGLDGPHAVPQGFWLAAATAATAADLVAPTLEANPGDAFCLGLLHTLGTALLHQRQPGAVSCLGNPGDERLQLQDEIETYGIDHAHAAAEVLAGWKFPTHLSELIATHHVPTLHDAPPLARVLSVARTLTAIALQPDSVTETTGSRHDLARLTQGRLDPFDLDSLVTQLRERADALHAALT